MTGVVRIRGAGVVCALGVGAAAVNLAIAEGREFGAFRPGATKAPGTEAGTHNGTHAGTPEGTGARAAYPAPFDAARDLPNGIGRRIGRQIAMSLAAVLEAVRAAVGPERAWRDDPADTGLVAATAHGPIDETVGFVGGALRDGPRYASPALFAASQMGTMAGVAARELGVRGPAIVTANGDVSFETALLLAVAGLRAGRMRRAIVVGADAFHPLYGLSLSEFHMVADSAEPVDPRMRRTTRGVHVGEGAGALVLDWDPAETDDDLAGGTRVEDVRVGAAVVRRDLPGARVLALATGDTASAVRHAEAVAACGVPDAEVEYPAARFGAFASLSAVAIAVDASRRLGAAHDANRGANRGGDELRPSLFLSAPDASGAASVVLAGSGRT